MTVRSLASTWPWSRLVDNQMHILQKLQQIRRELAKKERKLQKLKRLSAHKRSLESGDSSSIGPEDTRSSAGVCSPPIEATLSQREICRPKLIRTDRPDDDSLLARGRAGSFGQADLAEGSDPSSPGRGEVELTAAVVLKEDSKDDGDAVSIVEGGICNEVAVHATLSDRRKDLLESSQKEMFEDSEVCWASQGTHSSWRSQDSTSVIHLSATQNTEGTEPPCQSTEALEHLCSKPWSPARKRRRTICEQTADSASPLNYNFRKRRLSSVSPPLERRRVGREAKTVLGAFHKLVKQALELPVSMFQLHFEKLGLLQYLDAKGLSGQKSESTAGNSELSYGSDKTSGSLSVEPNMSISGNTLPKVLKPQVSGNLEPAGIAVLPLKSINIQVQSSTPISETKVTRPSHRRLLANNVVEDSLTTATLSAGRQHKRTTRTAHRTMSALTVEHNRSGQTTAVPSSVSPETELLSATRLQDVADVDWAASAHPMKQCSEVEASLLLQRGVYKAGDSCQQIERRNFTSLHEGLSRKTLFASGSCKIIAPEGQNDTTVEAPSQNISSALECASKHPLGTPTIKTKSSAEAKIASNGTTEMLPHSLSAAYSHSEISVPKSNTIRVQTVENHSDELSSPQSVVNGQSLKNGEIGSAAVPGGEVAVHSPTRSALFTQSEESDDTERAMTDLVTNVVEQLGSQEDGMGNCPAVGQHGDGVTILSDSATPDDLDIPEVQDSVLAPAPGAPVPLALCCGQENGLTEAQGSQLERDAESASCPGDSTDLLSSLRAHCNAQQGSSEGSANSASRPASPSFHPFAEGTREEGPSSGCPASLPVAQEDAQEGIVAGAPYPSSRSIAKKLFADPSGTDETPTVNSEAAELLDPTELEGMFDEWSEECAINGTAKPAAAGNAVDCRTATVGRCRTFDRPHSSTREAVQSIFAEQQAPATYLVSSSEEDRACKEEDGAECGSPGLLNQGHVVPDSRKLECILTHSLGRGDTEAGRNSPPTHQCSPWPPASLEALSQFSDEVCGGDTMHHAEERQLNSKDLVSATHRGGECVSSWCDEDCDGTEQSCVDKRNACNAAACHRGSLLGTRNPLFFFCALKCEQEQGVMATYLVQAEPRPFLVSVQASAISVWHLEHNTWRHSMAVGKLRFPVEGRECYLLHCGEWSVLAYLSPLVPTHVPCVQWRTADGGGRVQLMLTLGSNDGFSKRRRSLYRMAKLGREGWFVTALRTAHGATLLRVHRLRYMHGELGDETEPLGRTSNLLDSLVGVESHPDALLGNSGNIFYVWDCQSRLLVKKMIHEPDMFADLEHISWCCSDRGLLFVLMRSSDDTTSTLVAMNPFSCKAEVVSSSSWKLATQARSSDMRPCGVHVEGRYVACVGPGYGVRIWNLFTGNPVADMWYHSSTSVTMADVSGTTFVAIGSADGRVLVFTS
ncbi:uncharacterized protein LOC144102076 isoform X3 [Amblyomma americanum]